MPEGEKGGGGSERERGGWKREEREKKREKTKRNQKYRGGSSVAHSFSAGDKNEHSAS